VTVEVNIDRASNGISQHLYDKLKKHKFDYNIEISDNDILLKNIKLTPIDTATQDKIIL
jgi:hypothetical protein